MCLKLLGFIYAENLCCISGELVEREDKKPPEYWEGNPWKMINKTLFDGWKVSDRWYGNFNLLPWVYHLLSNTFVRFYAITFITFGVIVKCYC